MPFDPTLPVNNSVVRAAELRNQFNALKALDDAKLPTAEKGAANGVASLDGNGRVAQAADFATLANKPTPVADGTYTVGIGTVQNGTITVVGGIITAVQEANDGPPPPTPTHVAAGFGDAPTNGNYAPAGTFAGHEQLKHVTEARWLWWYTLDSAWAIATAADGGGLRLYTAAGDPLSGTVYFDPFEGDSPGGTVNPL